MGRFLAGRLRLVFPSPLAPPRGVEVEIGKERLAATEAFSGLHSMLGVVRLLDGLSKQSEPVSPSALCSHLLPLMSPSVRRMVPSVQAAVGSALFALLSCGVWRCTHSLLVPGMTFSRSFLGPRLSAWGTLVLLQLHTISSWWLPSKVTGWLVPREMLRPSPRVLQCINRLPLLEPLLLDSGTAPTINRAIPVWVIRRLRRGSLSTWRGMIVELPLGVPDPFFTALSWFLLQGSPVGSEVTLRWGPCPTRPAGGREERGRAVWPGEVSPGHGRGARSLVYDAIIIKRSHRRLCLPYSSSCWSEGWWIPSRVLSSCHAPSSYLEMINQTSGCMSKGRGFLCPCSSFGSSHICGTSTSASLWTTWCRSTVSPSWGRQGRSVYRLSP